MSTKTIKELTSTTPLSATPVVKLIKIHVSPEEQIIDEQIRKLQILSQQGSLELEDVKKLDLLIKNKRLCGDLSTLNANFNQLPEGTSDADLMTAAEGKDEHSEDTTESSPKDSVD